MKMAYVVAALILAAFGAGLFAGKVTRECAEAVLRTVVLHA
jgi:F0F1-type ATP synthase membrane subunit c/vacuolar-type H+-ATPase subunit K